MPRAGCLGAVRLAVAHLKHEVCASDIGCDGDARLSHTHVQHDTSSLGDILELDVYGFFTCSTGQVCNTTGFLTCRTGQVCKITGHGRTDHACWLDVYAYFDEKQGATFELQVL